MSRKLLTAAVFSMLWCGSALGVTTTDLISYWQSDEASGNLLDAHGSNALTETSGTIDSAAGKVGTARDYEAIDTEYFTKTDNTDLSMGDIDFTFSFWVNPETTPSNAAPFCKDNGTQREYGIYYSTGLRWYVFGSAGEFSEANGGTMSTATWYHVVVYHDATANTIGIVVNNGTPVTTAHTAGVRDSTAPFMVGAKSDGTNNWDGLIDEIGFWKRKLSAGDITDLYNSGNGLAYPFTSGGSVAIIQQQRNRGQ